MATSVHELKRQAKEIVALHFANGKAPVPEIPDDVLRHENEAIAALLKKDLITPSDLFRYKDKLRPMTFRVLGEHVLSKAAKAGDKKAQKYYNKIARAEGNANWQEYDAEKLMLLRFVGQELSIRFWDARIKSDPEWKTVLAIILNRRGIDITSDPVYRMIRTRVNQDTVCNDPVLGTILDAPIKDIYDATLARCDAPIQIASSNALPIRESPDQPRNQKIYDYWLKGLPDDDIAPLVNLTPRGVKNVRQKNNWIDPRRKRKKTV